MQPLVMSWCSVIIQGLVLSYSGMSWSCFGGVNSEMVLEADFAWRHCTKQGKALVTKGSILLLLQGEIWFCLSKVKIFHNETNISPETCSHCVMNITSLGMGAWSQSSVGHFGPPSCSRGEEEEENKRSLGKIPASKILILELNVFLNYIGRGRLKMPTALAVHFLELFLIKEWI